MSNFLTKTVQALPGLTKYGMVLLVIAFISFLFPNNAKFKYEFDKGQTWRYADLIAPFDYAIKKTQEEMENELQEVEQGFSPYYTVDLGRAIERKRTFDKLFQDQLEIAGNEQQFVDVLRNSRPYTNYSHAFIDRIYAQGVIDLAPEHQDKGKDFVINVIRGNTKTLKTLQSLYTPQKIQSWLTDSLFNSRLREAEFLIPILRDLFLPNMSYSDSLSNKFRTEEISGLSSSRGMVRKGELIVTSGGVVTDEIYQNLLSFKEQYEREVSDKKSHLGVFLGYFLLTSLIIGVFLLYLQYHAREVFNHFRQLIFMFLWLVVYSYFVYVLEVNSLLSVYIIPFCIVPIVIRIFYDERLALFAHIVVVLIASFLCSLGYEFTFLQVLAGIVAVLANIDIRDTSRFFFSMIYIFLAYALGYLGLSLIQDGSLASVDWSIYRWIFINVFLTLLAYPLIPLLERLFGFVSTTKLVELSDMTRPLLRELSIKAPGTLQHSLQVANLAEAAASRIGANTLLVKVAALYHDVGKMINPLYFIENQSGVNPHNEIDDLDSARIIINHVSEGVQLARKHGLPELLINFIKTHHGTTRTEYFYRNYQKLHTDIEVDETQFRYPGPRPRSKEETILMIADSLEAASKSLKDPSEKDINDLVEKIVEGKIAQGQLELSRLSFHELEACKREFKKLLKSIYHVRIEYPEEEKPS
ncbi:MAG: HDIG domain-containing metalloprotein [Bacteroidota bacterium]